jgi:hypothetical protein
MGLGAGLMGFGAGLFIGAAAIGAFLTGFLGARAAFFRLAGAFRRAARLAVVFFLPAFLALPFTRDFLAPAREVRLLDFFRFMAIAFLPLLDIASYPDD